MSHDVRTGVTVFTIGHSNHEIEQLIELLKQHRIEAIADVRSAPYSRWHPQFNRETLAAALKQAGIAYVFLGRELGARSDDPACYEDGRVQYRRLAQTSLFQSGLQRVLDGSQRMNLALMCAEKDPLDCHRTILVSRELVATGVEVVHVLADGAVELHTEAMKRLKAQLGLPDEDLFRAPDELLEDAYAAQEKRIAYVDQERA